MMQPVNPPIDKSMMEINGGSAPTEEMRNIVGERLGARIEELRETQTAIAKDVGLGSAQVLNNYITGKRQPKPDMIVALAKRLDVTTDWLLGATDSRAPAKQAPADLVSVRLPRSTEQLLHRLLVLSDCQAENADALAAIFLEALQLHLSSELGDDEQAQARLAAQFVWNQRRGSKLD